MRDAAARFAAEEVLPRVDSMDAASAMEPELISAIFDAGFMGVEIEEQHGGSGSSFTAACLVIEELAKADPSVSVMVDIHNTIVNNTFSMWASPELQQQWLPRLATDTLGAFCLSEASSGSDAFALKCTASRVGDDYELNGEKLWISNSKEAVRERERELERIERDRTALCGRRPCPSHTGARAVRLRTSQGVFLVMANAAPEKGYKGITCFVVPAETPGLTVGPREDKLGIRASSTCPVRLDGVRVPSSSVLGELGHGYKYAIEILNEGRVGIGAQMVGLAQGALDRTLPYLHERKQFGARIADFQGVQHQIAQLATELEAARLLVYNAARLKESGAPLVQEAAMAKLYSSQVAERVASKCVELLGGVGFTRSYGVEKLYRDAKIGAIYEGTSNVQLNTIAKIMSAPYRS